MDRQSPLDPVVAPGTPLCPECRITLLQDRKTSEWVCINCGYLTNDLVGVPTAIANTDQTSISDRLRTLNRVAERFGKEKAEALVKDDPYLRERWNLQLLHEVQKSFGSEKAAEIAKDDPSLEEQWRERNQRSKSGGEANLDQVSDEYLEGNEFVSGAWYLAPIFFGLIGGILAYLAVKDRNKSMAETCLGIGIVFTLLGYFGWIFLTTPR